MRVDDAFDHALVLLGGGAGHETLTTIGVLSKQFLCDRGIISGNGQIGFTSIYMRWNANLSGTKLDGAEDRFLDLTDGVTADDVEQGNIRGDCLVHLLVLLAPYVARNPPHRIAHCLVLVVAWDCSRFRVVVHVLRLCAARLFISQSLSPSFFELFLGCFPTIFGLFLGCF